MYVVSVGGKEALGAFAVFFFYGQVKMCACFWQIPKAHGGVLLLCVRLHTELNIIPVLL